LITSRVGATLALIFSLAALALAIVAYMSTVRDDTATIGRLVQTQLDNTYTGAPVAFPLDEFFIGRGSDGVLHAYYVYPPGYYGHSRGCKVVWDSTTTVDTPHGRSGPGMYLEPCGGAHFDRDGVLVSGPADRGMDYFATQPAVDGMLVDTRTLFCGEALVSDATPEASDETPTATPEPAQLKCERVSPNTKKP
jgi:hypothetical protein